jgi:hypothetical protein
MTNSKSQINSKSQFQTTEKILSGILNFAHWSLFVIWCLVFGASLHEKFIDASLIAG